jgi:hypothetical protein
MRTLVFTHAGENPSNAEKEFQIPSTSQFEIMLKEAKVDEEARCYSTLALFAHLAPAVTWISFLMYLIVGF